MTKILNLRISDADRYNIELLRNHGYNLSAFLRYCLKKKADELRDQKAIEIQEGKNKNDEI